MPVRVFMSFDRVQGMRDICVLKEQDRNMHKWRKYPRAHVPIPGNTWARLYPAIAWTELHISDGKIVTSSAFICDGQTGEVREFETWRLFGQAGFFHLSHITYMQAAIDDGLLRCSRLRCLPLAKIGSFPQHGAQAVGVLGREQRGR